MPSLSADRPEGDDEIGAAVAAAELRERAARRSVVYEHVRVLRAVCLVVAGAASLLAGHPRWPWPDWPTLWIVAILGIGVVLLIGLGANMVRGRVASSHWEFRFGAARWEASEPDDLDAFAAKLAEQRRALHELTHDIRCEEGRG
jgi:hypothetical protein